MRCELSERAPATAEPDAVTVARPRATDGSVEPLSLAGLRATYNG